MLIDLEFAPNYNWNPEVKLTKFEWEGNALITEMEYPSWNNPGSRELHETLVAEHLQLGVYETDLNFNHELEHYTKYKTDWMDKLNRYGVADNVEQILEEYDSLINLPGESFIVCVVRMVKSEQPSSGGLEMEKVGSIYWYSNAHKGISF